ncbi:MAG: DUF6580 family putative transport protein [Patescibacteria group bacterium]
MIFNREDVIKFAVAFLLVLIGVVFRLLPHPPNFTPVGAIALFAGVYLSLGISFVLPVVAMFISDIFLGGYRLPVMGAVYGSFLLTAVLGIWLRQDVKWYKVATGAVLSAVFFFLFTNFAVWAFTPWYSRDFVGLVSCYLAAIPFFKNTLAGNLFFTALFFGTYLLVNMLLEKLATRLKNFLISF